MKKRKPKISLDTLTILATNFLGMVEISEDITTKILTSTSPLQNLPWQQTLIRL